MPIPTSADLLSVISLAYAEYRNARSISFAGLKLLHLPNDEEANAAEILHSKLKKFHAIYVNDIQSVVLHLQKHLLKGKGGWQLGSFKNVLCTQLFLLYSDHLPSESQTQLEPFTTSKVNSLLLLTAIRQLHAVILDAHELQQAVWLGQVPVPSQPAPSSQRNNDDDDNDNDSLEQQSATHSSTFCHGKVQPLTHLPAVVVTEATVQDLALQLKLEPADTVIVKIFLQNKFIDLYLNGLIAHEEVISHSVAVATREKRDVLAVLRVVNNLCKVYSAQPSAAQQVKIDKLSEEIRLICLGEVLLRERYSVFKSPTTEQVPEQQFLLDLTSLWKVLTVLHIKLLNTVGIHAATRTEFLGYLTLFSAIFMKICQQNQNKEVSTLVSFIHGRKEVLGRISEIEGGYELHNARLDHLMASYFIRIFKYHPIAEVGVLSKEDSARYYEGLRYVGAFVDELIALRRTYLLRFEPQALTAKLERKTEKQTITSVQKHIFPVKYHYDVLNISFCHGTNSDLLPTLKALDFCLYSTGRLTAMGVVPMTGELKNGIGEGGINQFRISGTALDNPELAWKYANQVKFHATATSEMKKLRLFMGEYGAELKKRTNEKSLLFTSSSHYSTHAYEQLSGLSIAIERARILAPGQYQGILPDLTKLILTLIDDFSLFKQTDDYKKVMPKHLDPDQSKGFAYRAHDTYYSEKFARTEDALLRLRAALQKKLHTIPKARSALFDVGKRRYPIIFASTTLHAPQVSYNERAVAGGLKLGVDIQYCFTEAGNVGDLQKYLRENQLADRVQVMPIEELRRAAQIHRILSPFYAEYIPKNPLRDLARAQVAQLQVSLDASAEDYQQGEIQEMRAILKMSTDASHLAAKHADQDSEDFTTQDSDSVARENEAKATSSLSKQ